MPTQIKLPNLGENIESGDVLTISGAGTATLRMRLITSFSTRPHRRCRVRPEDRVAIVPPEIRT